MIVSHIAACSQNRVIGHEGKLPWHIPEDLKFFKDKTKGHILIMGRKTFESLGKALPKRYHIVISRDPNYTAPDIQVVQSYDQALELAKKELVNWGGEEVFVTGGGEIYKQTINQADKIYLTLIHQNYEGDAFYPEVDEKLFKLVERIDRTNPVPFSFLTYVKR